jgi:multidrug efflux pump subunit AcrA (membrane-fusion protein)
VNGDEMPGEGHPDEDPAADALLEEELRQVAAVLDPVPAELVQAALDAFALHDLDARLAELTFDSLVDALPVRGVVDAPRMLTFSAGEVTVDVEVTGDGLIGQVLPPQSARIEVLGGPGTARPVAADTLGRFTSDTPPAGPFALRLRTGAEIIITEWLRA